MQVPFRQPQENQEQIVDRKQSKSTANHKLLYDVNSGFGLAAAAIDQNRGDQKPGYGEKYVHPVPGIGDLYRGPMSH